MPNLKGYRVYVDNGNGTCSECALAVNPATRKAEPYPIKSKAKVAISRVRAMKLPIISKSKLKSFNMDRGNNYAVHASERPDGSPSVARQERPAISTQRKLLEFSIINLSNEPREFVFGDHHGFIADKLKLPQLDAAIQCEGAWGKALLAKFKQVTGANPHDIHSLHLTAYRITTSDPSNGEDVDFVSQTPNLPQIATLADDASFYTSGEIRDASIDFLGEILVNPTIKLSDYVNNGSFNKNIRHLKQHRKLVDGYAGYHIKMPAKSKLDVGMLVSAVKRSYGMVKANQWAG